MESQRYRTCCRRSWPRGRPGPPTRTQLGELELLTSGAFAPLAGYLTAADLAAVSERGQLADGDPVDRSRHADRAGRRRARRTPATWCCRTRRARRSPSLGITERVPAGRLGRRAAPGGPGDRAAPAGARAVPRAAPHARRGPRTARRVARAGVRDAAAARPAADRPAAAPGRPAAGQDPAAAPGGGPGRARRPARVACPRRPRRRAAAAGDTLVVPVPLPPRADPAEELRSRAVVAAAYGATHLLSESAAGEGGARTRSAADDFDLSKLGVEILAEGEWAFDPIAEVWRPLRLIEAGLERGELSDDELGELLDSGEPVPGWLMPADVAAELRRARPPRSAPRPGRVLHRAVRDPGSRPWPGTCATRCSSGGTGRCRCSTATWCGGCSRPGSRSRGRTGT